jgi:tetratricopeptide (TPR) repeat protein
MTGAVPLQWRVARYGSGAIIALAVAGSVFVIRKERPAVGPRDTIVMADIVNSTGDPAFDETLRQAFVIELDQTPFLQFVADSRVRETLRLMGRRTTDRVTPEVALEVCRREGAKAVLEGSITALGTSFVLHLNAVDCASGDAFAREQMQVARKEMVVAAVDELGSRMRTQLGESLGSIKRFDTPMERATTGSFEALQAFSQGVAARTRGADVEAIRFFDRAIELDPDFALAHARLSAIYSTAGEFERAAQHAARAYERKAIVGDRERYAIEYGYDKRVTGDLDKAIATLHAYAAAYPRDFDPPLNLSNVYAQTGDFLKALDEATHALSLNPAYAQVSASLARARLALNQIDEARRVSDNSPTGSIGVAQRSFLHWIAFMQHDGKAVQRQIDWATGTAAEPYLRIWHAYAAAAAGRFEDSRREFATTITTAERLGLSELAATSSALAAIDEAAVASPRLAESLAQASLGRMFGRHSSALAAIALAFNRQDREAVALDDRLAAAYPQDTLLHDVWLRCTRALVALNRDRPADAIEQLRPAARYELGWTSYYLPPYIRGLAYLRMNDGVSATREFQKIVEHPGVLPVSPLGSLAHLQLARARTMSNDAAGAAREYQAFFTAWHGADPNLPALADARSEFARLQSPHPAVRP